MRITFLGHQSWLIESGESRLLLDPLLVEYFGNGPPHEDAAMYPPRSIDWSAFPPIDAVFLSHEHEDHFNVQSLLRLDRRVPIYLSDRSSQAARTILNELGFVVHNLCPRQPAQIGSLEVHAFAQELGWEHPGEWDTLAIVVRDSGGPDCFLTTVDLRATPALYAQLAAARLRPVVWTWPDNEMSFSWLVAGAPHESDTTAQLVEDIRETFSSRLPVALRPELLVVSGNGYSFRRDLDWANGALFPRSGEAACRALQSAGLPCRTAAPLPGDVVVIRGGKLVQIAERAKFLSLPPRSAWPVHDALTPVPVAHAQYEPATGVRDLTKDEAVRLPDALRAFAQFLYGSPVFVALGRRQAAVDVATGATIALGLLHGEQRAHLMFAYDTRACQFVLVEGTKPTHFVAGLELWASDLLAMLESRMAAARVLLGRCRAWQHDLSIQGASLLMPLFQYAHPLRDPAGYLALYRAQAEHFGAEQVCVRGPDPAAQPPQAVLPAASL